MGLTPNDWPHTRLCLTQTSCLRSLGPLVLMSICVEEILERERKGVRERQGGGGGCF